MKTLGAHQVARQLKSFGLSDSDIATAVRVTTRTVRRWRKEPDVSAANDWRRLDNLRAIVLILRDRGVTEIQGWLRAREPTLGYKRPLDVLRAGGFEQVRKAAMR